MARTHISLKNGWDTMKVLELEEFWELSGILENDVEAIEALWYCILEVTVGQSV